MPYNRHPLDYCVGTWPDGPFTVPDGQPEQPGELAAVRAVAATVSAIVKRRTVRKWSRALLAREAGVGQHTVGKIEAGRAWPDLATVARLARALNLQITVGPPGPPGPPARPAAESASSAAPSSNGRPLDVDLSGLAEPTAAHVIEAILHDSPRMRAQVEDLRRQRAARAAAAR